MVAILCNQGRNIPFVSRLVIICNAGTLILLSMKIRGRWYDVLSKLSVCVFFIYALHNTCILAVTGKMIVRATPFIGEGIVGNTFYYFVTPFATVAVCVAIYYVLKKTCPPLLRVLQGGRG